VKWSRCNPDETGTRVAWINRLGSYAEQIVLPVEQAVLVPNSFGISDRCCSKVSRRSICWPNTAISVPGTLSWFTRPPACWADSVQWLKHLGGRYRHRLICKKARTARRFGADHTVTHMAIGFFRERGGSDRVRHASSARSTPSRRAYDQKHAPFVGKPIARVEFTVWSAPSDLAVRAFLQMRRWRITIAPRCFNHCTRICPTPPAAE